ncbi:MAG: FAD-binding oxidoreductase [Betaproteobacteria bacterium]|nr:FAD-binding oxidoreductase [Betaproteobacteria bacterium]
MRKITIIGAGHAGLQLGSTLVSHGYDVTIVSARTGAEIGAGKILSSQSMYALAVGQERAAGLAFWDAECPPIAGLQVNVGNDDAGVMLNFQTPMAAGQAVDQRMKMPRWIAEFERRGGKLVIQSAGIPELETYAAESDLVLVAAGKGDLASMFPRDAERSQLDRPQRTTALTYVHGMKNPSPTGAVEINGHPGIGELAHFPGLTHSGPCQIINLECMIDGPMDRWSEVKTPADHLALTLELIRKFFPWEAERFADARLTDDNAILAGRVTPTVRKPVGTLPSGRHVLGIGDVFVLNDPITGQGSNNASKAATRLLAAILAREAEPFDREWMQMITDQCWDEIRWAAKLANTMLLPPEPYLLDLFGACSAFPGVARKLADGFTDPRTLNPWFFDEAEAKKVVEGCAAMA